MSDEKIAIKQEQTGNRQLNQIQANAAESARAINRIPFASGALTDAIAWTAGQTRIVAHKLGRVPQGFFVVSALAAAPALYLTTNANVLSASIKSDNAGTYRIWFF